MEELIAGLPPYLKYVVLAMVPWIELRGAVPLAVNQGEQIYLPLILIANCLVFFPTYFILRWFYHLIPEGSWLHRKLDNARAKAHPKVERYGLLGLALFVAVPLPGTGAYSGTVAAWLLDIEWHRALLAVCIGVTSAFVIVWGASEAFAAGVRLF